MKVFCYILVVVALILRVYGNEQFGIVKDHILAMKKEIKSYTATKSIEFFEELLDDEIHSTNEFRVVVNSRRVQCFYQEAEKSTILGFAFECMSSPSFASSGKISASVILLGDNDGKESQFVKEKRRGEFEITAKRNGIYGFCLDNLKSREKVVVQVAMEVWRMAEVPKFHLKSQLSNDSMYHVFDGLFQVFRDVSTMRSAVTHTRSQLVYDYVTRTSNFKMINNFSIVSVIMIVAVSVLQLHFVKRMFGNVGRVGV